MFFLLKCAVCLGFVLFLLMRGDAPRAALQQPPAAASARELSRKQPKPAPLGAGAAWLREGAAGLSRAAAERCLDRPADCLAAAELARRAASAAGGSKAAP